MASFEPRDIFGVDFSGAARPGRKIWICHARPTRTGLKAISLTRFSDQSPATSRSDVHAGLVALIRQSESALWGIDFPFGLPVDLGLGDWAEQLEQVAAWTDTEQAFGLHCCALAEERFGRKHVRRDTDRETKTPFDCYHYYIIYQTFYGMRDVLGPLGNDRSTVILPFQKITTRAKRVVAEICPSSTIKRLGLPHQNYKQNDTKPLADHRKAVRRTLMKGIRQEIELSASNRKKIADDGPGDALDAVVAAIGVWSGWQGYDARQVARHERYSREGLVLM